MRLRLPWRAPRSAQLTIAALIGVGGVLLLLAYLWLRQVALNNALAQAVQHPGVSVEVVRTLLRRGAHVNARELYFPSFSASPWDLRDLAEWMQRPERRNGGTALGNAACFGRTDLVRELVARGADANLPSGEGHGGYSPILDWSRVAQEGNGKRVEIPNSTEVARLLLDHGADVNAVNDVGSTPLMFAVDYHRANSVRLLLSRGANPNARDHHGRTPLLRGIGSGNVSADSVAALLEAGADVNARTGDGFTPLRRALLAHSPPAILTLLRQAGARE